MRLSHIVGALLGVMVVIHAAWEVAERAFLGPQATDLNTFFLIRGVSTAVIMTCLTAWLLIRYRKRYEDELRYRSEEAQRMRVFFENIVRDAGEAIVSLDKEGIIRAWNRAAEEIYGYKADEIIGSSFHRLVPPDLLEGGEPEMIMEALRSNGYLRKLETRRLRKDGSTIKVRITSSILRDNEGRMIGSSAIISDITAEEEMESRLIQAEKLAAVGQAAASTAHEVRNALAGIAGTIEVLERSPAWRELPEDVGHEVKLQISRISHIIDDLLNYARPGSLTLRRSDLHQIIDKAIAATASHPDAAGKKLIRRYSQGPLFLEVDSVRLEQAFQNLLTNAYQAMRAGDRLEITTAGDGGRITIRFTDHGAGMSEETIARALDPFYTTKAKGTGLGLAIVQAIVEAHRGTIALASKAGSGTSVTLTLPDAGTIEGKIAADQDGATLSSPVPADRA